MAVFQAEFWCSRLTASVTMMVCRRWRWEWRWRIDNGDGDSDGVDDNDDYHADDD